jgi:hypothetical protein
MSGRLSARSRAVADALAAEFVLLLLGRAPSPVELVDNVGLLTAVELPVTDGS